MAKIGSLNVDLTLETARFNRNLQGAQTTMGQARERFMQMSNAMAGLLTATAVQGALTSLRDMSKQAIDTAGNLGEQAAALGISTTALQEYRYAATQVNLSAQEMDQAFAQLTRRTGDAANGSGEAARAFARLGIDIRDASGNVRNAADLMPEIADALKQVPSEAERAAIAVDLFGRSGQKLAALLEGGADGINNYAEAAHRLGIVLSSEEIANADKVADELATLNYVIEAQQNRKLLENSEAILEYEQSIGDLKLRLIGMSNTLQRWVDDFDAMNARNAEAAREAGVTIPQLFQALWERFDTWTQDMNASGRAVAQWMGDMATSIAAKFGDLATRGVAWMRDLYTGVRQWLRDSLGGVFDWVIGKVREVERAFHWMADQVVFNSHVPDMVIQIGQWMAQLQQRMVDPALGAAQATDQAFATMANNVLGSIDRLVGGIKRGGLQDILGGVLGVLTGVGVLKPAAAGGGFTGGADAWARASIIPGWANGGAMRLGGLAGIDRNLLSLNGSPIARVSAGEVLSVSPANDRGGALRVTVTMDPSTGALGAFVQDQAGRVVAQAAPFIAREGANQAVAAIAEINERALG